MNSAMIKQHHVEGRFSLFHGTHGSRENPVESGYHPQHKVHDNYQTSGRHEYPEVEQLAPGASAKVHIWFITPEVYPGSLWIGREIEVLEGSRVVGKLLVTRILDQRLEGSVESYKPLWIAPPGMEAINQPQSMVVIVGVSLFYLLLAGAALICAMNAYTPCVSNFEGGCGMAKGMLALASLLPAALAACLAFVLKSGLSSHPRFQPRAKLAGVILGGIPLAYILVTLEILFLG